MCFDLDSRPPIAPIAGGALDSERLTLSTRRRHAIPAFRARAAEPSGAGMIVLPDVRGLHTYYEELALRFAEAGIDAIAIDYFGRTAGTSARGDDFDYTPHVGQLQYDAVVADIRAAADELRRDGRVRSLFAVGFCMGGRLAFLTPTMGLGIAGAIGFYGWPTGAHRSGSPAPAEVASQIDGAILGIFGGADQGINAGVVEEFRTALVAADVDHELITYEGAPHSFFDRKAAEFAEQSADAWRRTLEFVRRTRRLGVAAGRAQPRAEARPIARAGPARWRRPARWPAAADRETSRAGGDVSARWTRLHRPVSPGSSTFAPALRGETIWRLPGRSASAAAAASDRLHARQRAYRVCERDDRRTCARQARADRATLDGRCDQRRQLRP